MADEFNGLWESITDQLQKLTVLERNSTLDLTDEYVAARAKALIQEGKTKLQIEETIAAEISQKKAEYAKKHRLETLQAELDDLRKVAEATLDADERRKAKQAETDKKKELDSEKRKQQAADQAYQTLKSGIDGAYNKITEAAKYYSSLVEKVQTRLFGSGKDFESVSTQISKAFAVSPFFAMKDAMNKVAAFVESGIAYNVELRASMAVMSDKIANTFNAFDDNLLRLIRVQQSDSTQARLGMESILTQFLNNQYKDTSYLNSLSKVVSGSLLEAASLMSRDVAATFELSVQKWLGSLYSLGVSDNLVAKLAEGIGALASGDIDKLNSQSDLQSLLVMSANNAGLSYGDMLLDAPTPGDIDKLFTGFTQLMLQIAESGKESTVALNQYAKVFGLSVSDLNSTVKNLTEENLKQIKSLSTAYSSMIAQVENQSSFSSLWSRTGGAELADNLMENMFMSAGKQIGKSAGGFLAWQVAGIVNTFLDGIETGVSFTPFGVGTEIGLAVGDITKVATVVGAMAVGLASVAGGLSSIKGINLGALENAERNTSGTALQLINKGTSESFMHTSVMDVSTSSMYDQAQEASKSVSSQVSDKNFDEEEEKMKKTTESLKELGDNVKFIVQMLNQTGIVIRGRTGLTTADSLFDTIRVV